MKSVKVVALLVVGIFLLTGCGSQKLTCTMSEEEDGLLTTNEVVMEFDDEKVSQVTMTVDMKITEEVSDDEWEASKSLMTGIFEETNENGIQLSTAVDDSEHAFRMVLDIDLTKASADALEEYGLEDMVNSTATYDEIKANAEDDGYTCK